MVSKEQLMKADVPARIHQPRFRSFWEKDLKANPVIMDILEHGYRMPLTQGPPESDIINNASAQKPENQAFMDEEMVRLEKVGAIKRVTKKPHLI